MNPRLTDSERLDAEAPALRLALLTPRLPPVPSRALCWRPPCSKSCSEFPLSRLGCSRRPPGWGTHPSRQRLRVCAHINAYAMGGIRPRQGVPVGDIARAAQVGRQSGEKRTRTTGQTGLWAETRAHGQGGAQLGAPSLRGF